MSRRSLLLAACGTAALAASLTIPALVLDASQYVALAAGVQAFGVVAALVFGAATLAREAKDKRLDRVAAIFDGYQTAHSDARYRLLGLLEGPEGRSKPASARQIRQDPAFSQYPDMPGANPRIDAERILLFFESLNGLRCAGALDLPLAHRLFGRNILWWDFAIAYEPFTQMRDPLRDLAEWVRAYNRSHRPAYLGEWQASLVGFCGPVGSTLIEKTPVVEGSPNASASAPPNAA
jgi:hypothetical protein